MGAVAMNEKTIAVGAVAVIVLYLFFKKEAAQAIAAVGQAVNPTSDKNLAYSGVNAVGSAVSGQSDWTLGGWLYDATHPTQYVGDTRKTAVADNFWNQGVLQ